MNFIHKAMMVLIMAAVAVLVFVLFLPMTRNVQNFRKVVEQKQQLLAMEQSREQELRREIQLLRTSPEYNERIAREKLGLVKPGEMIFRFAPLSTESAVSPVPAATARGVTAAN